MAHHLTEGSCVAEFDHLFNSVRLMCINSKGRERGNLRTPPEEDLNYRQPTRRAPQKKTLALRFGRAPPV